MHTSTNNKFATKVDYIYHLDIPGTSVLVVYLEGSRWIQLVVALYDFQIKLQHAMSSPLVV